MSIAASKVKKLRLELQIESTSRPNLATTFGIKPQTLSAALAEQKSAPILHAVTSFSFPIVDTKAGNTGKVVLVQLQLRKYNEPKVEEKWVLKAENQEETDLFTDFLTSLNHARLALNALDPNAPIWPEDSGYFILWQFTDKVESIDRQSGGLLFALGAFELFRLAGLIPQSHRLNHCWDVWRDIRAPFGVISASAVIAADGVISAVNAEGLESKAASLKAAGITKLLVAPGNIRAAARHEASSSIKFLPVGNLQDALTRVPNIQTVAKRAKWKRQMFVGGSAVLAAWIFADYAVTNYRLVGLEESLSGQGVMVTESQQADDKLIVVEIPRFSAENWQARIQPALAKFKRPFALILGSKEATEPPEAGYALDVRDLRMLTSLTVLRCDINKLSGINELERLKSLTMLGGRVEDLRDFNLVPNLQTLVVNSGFVRHFPFGVNERMEHLENLVLNLPATTTYLDLGGCRKLKNLALGGENLTRIDGMGGTSVLESLVLNCPNLSYQDSLPQRLPHLTQLHLTGANFLSWDCSTWDKLKALTLIEPTALTSLSVSKSLLKLNLEKPVALEALSVPEGSSLQEMYLSQTEKLEALDFSGASNLRKLNLSGQISMLRGLHHLVNLEEFSATGTNITDFNELAEAKALATVDLSQTKLSNVDFLKKLTRLNEVRLERTEVGKLPDLDVEKCTFWMSETPYLQSHPGSPCLEWNRKRYQDSKEWAFYEYYEPNWDYTWQEFDDEWDYGGYGYESVEYWSATPVSSYKSGGWMWRNLNLDYDGWIVPHNCSVDPLQWIQKFNLLSVVALPPIRGNAPQNGEPAWVKPSGFKDSTANEPQPMKAGGFGRGASPKEEIIRFSEPDEDDGSNPTPAMVPPPAESAESPDAVK